MSTRHAFALIVVICTVGQIGCCAMMQNGGCGMGGQVYDGCPSCGVADASCGCPSCGVTDSCCDDPSCGLADASCGCPDASCGCPDASCGCSTDCGGGVGCGAPVAGRCRLLARIRKALNGCSTCSGCGGGSAYWSEWQDSPPSQCESCDRYGNYTGRNYTGGPYGSPHGRRAQMARRNLNIENELQFGEEGSETIYR